MKKLTIALGTILINLIAFSNSANAAGFVNDRRGWFALTAEARAAYVQGLNDSLNFVFVDDPLVDALVKSGRTKCLIDRKMTAASIADRISFNYQDDKFAGYAPTALYILRMGEICKFYIDKERNAFGLGPM